MKNNLERDFQKQLHSCQGMLCLDKPFAYVPVCLRCESGLYVLLTHRPQKGDEHQLYRLLSIVVNKKKKKKKNDTVSFLPSDIPLEDTA
jgi:hypothetical protein